MTRIQVTTDNWAGKWKGIVYDHAFQAEGSGWWSVRDDEGHSLWFLPSEVRVLGRHESTYDADHWGEQNPDSYDRMGFDTNHGRHLLHTGTE